MKIFFSAKQLLHVPRQEFVSGELRPAMETPHRAEMIASALREADLGPILEPRAYDRAFVERIHDRGFIEFVATLDERWSEAYPGTVPFPESGLAPGMRRRLPQLLRAQLPYYCFDSCTPVLKGTITSALASIDTALSGIEAIKSDDRLAFSLCRPPGHHAGTDFYGGYCFFNNAAIAAQSWVDSTGTRCAVLDVDYHHGNGTQQIFYDRDDVFYVSIHGDPAVTYPFFSGYPDETGAEIGMNSTLNLPLIQGTKWPAYEYALHTALDAIARFAPGSLVVSLGVDTFEKDPIASFKLLTGDFTRMGRLISQLQCPTLVVMEGGYAIKELGENVVSFLSGLLSPKKNPGGLLTI